MNELKCLEACLMLISYRNSSCMTEHGQEVGYSTVILHTHTHTHVFIHSSMLKLYLISLPFLLNLYGALVN